MRTVSSECEPSFSHVTNELRRSCTEMARWRRRRVGERQAALANGGQRLAFGQSATPVWRSQTALTIFVYAERPSGLEGSRASGKR